MRENDVIVIDWRKIAGNIKAFFKSYFWLMLVIAAAVCLYVILRGQHLVCNIETVSLVPPKVDFVHIVRCFMSK
jgi:hypothetical protein